LGQARSHADTPTCSREKSPTCRLAHKDLEHLLASCASIDLIFADVLSVAGERIRHVYFQTDSFIPFWWLRSMATPVRKWGWSAVKELYLYVAELLNWRMQKLILHPQ
jgi:hypothetical protein